jgi:hypothetical protein
MKWLSIFLLAAATSVSVDGSAAFTAGQTNDNSSPIYGVTIPAGYRQWELVSVAHEAGDYDDLRATLGNTLAMTAFRNGKLPFPDGTIIARLAWKYVPSAENNKVFGQSQSFIAGAATNVQFMVKDSKSTPRRAAGGSPYSRMANRAMRRCTKHASPATSLRKCTTSSLRVTRLEGRMCVCQVVYLARCENERGVIRNDAFSFI